jgi:Rad3-related DNA helicase
MCYVGFKLTPQILGTLIPKKQTMEDYIQVIRDCEKAIKENRKKSAERIVEADKYVQGKLAVEIEEIERLLSKVNFFLNQIDRDPDNWVFNIELDEYSMVRHLEIKPVMINDYANELLFQYGEKVVCLSATVEPESFCSSLGINRDELFYIEIPSTFPIENRPIYKDYIGNISAKTIHALLPAIAEKVREYLAMYPNEKGLIHTHTFQISNYIQQHVKDERLIFYGGNNILNRQEAQDLHCRVSDPTVLVAPSLTEGFDGKEDLARWQIIIKTPYPYIGDKQIKVRMDRDYLWYINQVIQTVCQASGRVVRSEIDHGDTYILDLGFEKVLFRYEKYFPIWFLEALTERQVEVEW